MTDRKGRLEDQVRTLARQPGVLGAVLVTRDGLCVLNESSHLSSPETFSAMSAAVFAASETALAQVGSGGARHVVIEGDRCRMVAVGASDEHLLVVFAEPRVALDELLRRVDAAAMNVSGALVG